MARRKGGDSAILMQQRVLISWLGLAHEGKQIGDEALWAYVDLFLKPLSSAQIAAVLALYGWELAPEPLTKPGMEELSA